MSNMLRFSRGSARSHGGWTSRLRLQCQEAHGCVRGGLRWAARAVLLFLGAVAALIIAYAFINPPVSTLMLLRQLEDITPRRQWVALTKISPQLQKAVIVSEDGRFCSHWGVDWREIGNAIGDVAEGGRLRGASTIPMQTMKNLFLWPGRDPVRKTLEVPLALASSALWSKRRMLEIYLNIAEWGPGIFGAEAAARHYFGKSAAKLSDAEAASLAVRLPGPLLKSAGTLPPSLRRRAGTLLARMRKADTATSCLRS